MLSRDGNRLIATNTLGFTGVWNTATGELLAGRGEGPAKRIDRMIHYADDQKILCLRNDRTLRIWQLEENQLVEIQVLMSSHLGNLKALAIGANLSTVATGDPTGVINLWTLSPTKQDHLGNTLVTTLPEHYSHLQFLSDNRSLAALQGDLHSGQLVIRDVLSGRKHRVFSNVLWHRAAKEAPDGRSIAIAREGGMVELIDIASGDVLTTLSGPEKDIRCLFFTPDSRLLLTGSGRRYTERGEILEGDRTVRLWETRTGRLIQEVELPEILQGMTMAPDGKTFAVHLEKAVLEVRRTEDFSLIFQKRLSNYGGPAAAFSPDGKLLAVS